MKKKMYLVSLLGCFCAAWMGGPASADPAGARLRLAQLPLQQQTDDPHLKMILADSVAEAPLTWKTPEGWTETRGSGMRLVTFSTGGSEPIECSIIILKGTAGGVDSNVARWMNQIGLNLGESELAAFLEDLEQVKTQAGHDAHLVDFTLVQEGASEHADSLLAAILPLDSETVFIKMGGTLKAVQKNKEHFRALVRSLSI